ncbi:FAD-dependent oxidoreductase [Kineosporia babensis]|uniref:FAD-dependent oxidoreductase n=1 Tax=Kineosporia babensis TaxID=499548 RepID=A0A9X1NAY0_9ACTN|nr:FAD-dependent oxidoreductase [Kineosporia babensis]MCD5311852.1 FAD-dependent oxidoreductase [Kineosporia babensis]
MRSEEVDTVVIGSGVGGLAAARALAEFGGQRVLVLEQHYTLGGMTHEFSREGRFHFNTGLHYLSARHEPFLQYLTEGQLQLAPMPQDFDILHFTGFDFAVPGGLGEYERRLCELFPDEAEAITRYFGQALATTDALYERNDLVSLPGADLVEHEKRFPLVYRTLEEHLQLSFRNPRLRAILGARWALYGPPPELGTFSYHAAVTHSYYGEGGCHPVGGAQEVGRLSIEALQRRGVQLRARQRVQRVLIEDGRAVGVEVLGPEGLYQVKAETVISDAGHVKTYELIGRPAPLQSLGGFSCVSLFLGLDRSPAEFGPRGGNHWFMPDDDETFYVAFASLNNPAARHHTVEAFAMVDPADFDRWRDAKDESYRQFKRDKIEQLITRLDTQWPGLREAIVFAELATPLTFETYQNSDRGIFYGLPATPERLRSTAAGPLLPVEGLILAGQDADMPGVVGALSGGLRAAGLVLEPEQTGTMWETVSTYQAAPAESGYLKVAAVQQLTASVKRFRLEPLNGDELPFTFQAGQYLTLDLPVAIDPIARSYSICSSPAERGFVEIAVKREPEGLGSVFLNDELAAGQVLRSSGPLGDFTCDFAEDPGPLLLIAGGIGITPLLSVLHAAVAAGHQGRITLLAAYRGELPFADELPALPGLEVQLFPSEAGQRIGAEQLTPYVADVSRVHVCGPAPMMQAILGHLADLGVPRDRVHTEAFVSGDSKQTRLERAHAIALAATVDEFTIAMPDGKAFPCRPGESLLTAANDAGVEVEQSCEEGVCGSCKIRVLSGPADSDPRGQFSTAEIDAGWTLACQTLPTGDLMIAQ